MRSLLGNINRRYINSWRVELRSLLGSVGTFPDFLIIGAQKSGTSTLFRILANHPDVKPEYKKEIHFFDRNISKGPGWYRAHFPSGSKEVGFHTFEATPDYLFHPLAPKLVHAMLPGIKLIVLLRDPVLRAYSHYQMMVRRGIEKDPDFSKRWKEDLIQTGTALEKIAQGTGNWNYNLQKFGYVHRGYYDDQIGRWLEYFDPEQVLILSSDLMFSETDSTLSRVYSFLGIKEQSHERLINKNKGEYQPLNSEAYQELASHYYTHNVRLLESIDFKPKWIQAV